MFAGVTSVNVAVYTWQVTRAMDYFVSAFAQFYGQGIMWGEENSR